MKKTFDQKWGTKVLIAVVTFVVLYSCAPIVFGEWQEYYKTMDDSSGEEFKDDGQNLYYYVYDKIKVGPATAALASTATYFGYGTSDLNLGYVTSIVDGNTSAKAFGVDTMLAFDPEASEYVETEDLGTIQGRYDKGIAMKTYFYNALSDESLKSELSVKTETNEMYANGDTSDSGFDIIIDLKTIEYILFAEVTDTWSGDSDNGDDDNGTDSDGSDGSDDESSEGSDESEGDSSSSEVSDSVVSETVEAEGEFLECFDDNVLSGAIDDFRGNSSVTADENPDDITPDAKSTGSAESTAEDDFYSTLEGPESADWSRDLPCDDILCLEINFVTGDDEDYPYEETDNCVACHISYVKQTLEDITAHDLTPNKLTGSMMEDATCKTSFSALVPSFGVFVLTNPILTPPNDDIVVSIGDIIANLQEALYPNTTTGATASDYSSLTDKYTALVQNIYGTTSISDNTDEILALTTQELEAQIEALTEYAVATQMSDMNTMYQALSYEMAQTNSFFTAIELILLDAQVYLDAISKKDYIE